MVLAYVASSLFVFLGALMLMGQYGIGDPSQGSAYTLTSITAVVLGGTSLLGGRGTFVGALAGAVLLQQVLNATGFLGLGLHRAVLLPGRAHPGRRGGLHPRPVPSYEAHVGDLSRSRNRQPRSHRAGEVCMHVTPEEEARLVASVPHGLWIDGAPTVAEGGRTLPVHDPATGERALPRSPTPRSRTGGAPSTPAWPPRRPGPRRRPATGERSCAGPSS